VLRAAFDADVRCVVITSSSAAVRDLGAPSPSRPLTEDDWADPGNPKLTPYAKSKTIAERSAWDYADKAGVTDRLAVVNPRGDHRPAARQPPLVLAANRRTYAQRRHACHPPDWVLPCRCPGPRRPAPSRDVRARGGGPAVPGHPGFSCGWPTSPPSCAANWASRHRRSQAAKRRTRFSGLSRCSTRASGQSSVGLGSERITPQTKP
jgi:hypothetical protein